MEAQDNKQLALLKAISSHEQAAAALNDLIDGPREEVFAPLLERVEQNIAELKRMAASSRPGDLV